MHPDAAFILIAFGALSCAVAVIVIALKRHARRPTASAAERRLREP